MRVNTSRAFRVSRAFRQLVNRARALVLAREEEGEEGLELTFAGVDGSLVSSVRPETR